jgi:hypothetical protein
MSEQQHVAGATVTQILGVDVSSMDPAARAELTARVLEAQSEPEYGGRVVIEWPDGTEERTDPVVGWHQVKIWDAETGEALLGATELHLHIVCKTGEMYADITELVDADNDPDPIRLSTRGNQIKYADGAPVTVTRRFAVAPRLDAAASGE